ncbi:MAG: hypothetical protein QOJ42_8090 [Acidobacteriaceae bacterium]|jgi:hypothetical protein|nr:hypothetical protein [Acidobacteriaceae bacterium]MDT7818174.1 hypothetical protein [Acidobacteriaceae bacterium]
MFAFGVILTFGSLVHHPDMKKWDGRSIGRPRRGRASVGKLRTVLNVEPRTPGGARSMHKCELRKERDGFERNPKWKDPTLLARIWEEIRHILFPSRRRF